jgi:hypothetical protein
MATFHQIGQIAADGFFQRRVGYATPAANVPDGDIQFAVNSIWNLLAGA